MDFISPIYLIVENSLLGLYLLNKFDLQLDISSIVALVSVEGYFQTANNFMFLVGHCEPELPRA